MRVTVRFFRVNASGGGVDCEQLAECQVIQDIQTNIEQLSLDLGEEISLREQGDEALSNAIDAEATARSNADTNLQNQITALQSSIDDAAVFGILYITYN